LLSVDVDHDGRLLNPASAAPGPLDLDHATAFLLARNLVEVSEIVDGHLEVAALRGRNLNLRVERRRASGYLIKKPDPGMQGSRETVAMEAAFYDLCRRQPRLAELERWLPRLHRRDAADGLLVTELLADHLPLWHHGPAKLVAPCHELGALLGTLHRLFRNPEAERLSGLPELPDTAPWALTVFRPRIELLTRMSGAQRRMLALVQQQPKTTAVLEASLPEWRRETLIHGDVRSENVLAGERGIVLVDWELVQWGDPAWDVAGGLQDLLLYWLRSLPTAPELSPEQRAARAGCPLSKLRPAILAFWRGYRQAADQKPEATGALLHRAIRFSAARLLQSAYEQAAGHRVLPDLAVLSLQVATNILAAPERALDHLYALASEPLDG